MVYCLCVIYIIMWFTIVKSYVVGGGGGGGGGDACAIVRHVCMQ